MYKFCLLIFFMVFILIPILKSPWFKGVFGEFMVNLMFKLFLPSKEYRLLKNITLPTEDGTTQIDHILVSEYGIFVVETKNIRGEISGSDYGKNWVCLTGSNKYTFNNPLRQNHKHTKTLEDMFSVSGSCIHSVVVFVGEGGFLCEMPPNVTYRGDVINHIKSKKEIVFTPAQVNEIVNVINTVRLPKNIITNLKHRAHVKKIIANKR